MEIIHQKAKVISFPDDYMRDSFSPYVRALGEKAKDNHEKRVQFTYLLKAMDYMQYVSVENLPINQNGNISTTLEIRVDGKKYSEEFILIKALNRENIFELRINVRKFPWRFRGIFFPYNNREEQYYCFVFPFEKQKQIRVNLT